MRVGFVGLGAMGSGMARNLHRAGLLVGVFNRTAAKAQALAAELKLTAYPTVQALGADVDAVVSCVSADADAYREVARKDVLDRCGKVPTFDVNAPIPEPKPIPDPKVNPADATSE